MPSKFLVAAITGRFVLWPPRREYQSFHTDIALFPRAAPPPPPSHCVSFHLFRNSLDNYRKAQPPAWSEDSASIGRDSWPQTRERSFCENTSIQQVTDADSRSNMREYSNTPLSSNPYSRVIAPVFPTWNITPLHYFRDIEKFAAENTPPFIATTAPAPAAPNHRLLYARN